MNRSYLRLLDEAFLNLSPKTAVKLRAAASRGRSVLHFSDINKLRLNPRAKQNSWLGSSNDEN